MESNGGQSEPWWTVTQKNRQSIAKSNHVMSRNRSNLLPSFSAVLNPSQRLYRSSAVCVVNMYESLYIIWSYKWSKFQI